MQFSLLQSSNQVAFGQWSNQANTWGHPRNNMCTVADVCVDQTGPYCRLNCCINLSVGRKKVSTSFGGREMLIGHLHKLFCCVQIEVYRLENFIKLWNTKAHTPCQMAAPGNQLSRNIIDFFVMSPKSMTLKEEKRPVVSPLALT